MKRFLPLVLPLAFLPSLACDDGTGGTGGAGTASTDASGSTTTVTASNSGSGSTGTGSSTSSGMIPDLSECDTSNDCPGGVCVAVNGAFKMCAAPIEEATLCTNPELDECCSTSECTATPGAKCVKTPVVAQCSGVPPLEYNVCAVDECGTNADCPGGVCAPPGTVGNKVRTCVAAQCNGTSCPASAEHPGGLPCALVREPCCNTPQGFYCIDTCRQSSDCMDGYCEVDPMTNTPACKSGSPICPA